MIEGLRGAMKTTWPVAIAVGLMACAPTSDESAREGEEKKGGGVEQSLISPTSSLAEVDWAAATNHVQVAPSALPKRLQFLKASPVPALVPQVQSLLLSGVPTQGPSWYAVSMSVEQHTVFISGTRTEVFVPGVSDRTKAPPDFELRISRSRGVVSASFLAFGIAYVVEVECERPFEDLRCVDDDYVRTLVEELAVVGGGA